MRGAAEREAEVEDEASVVAEEFKDQSKYSVQCGDSWWKGKARGKGTASGMALRADLFPSAHALGYGLSSLRD